MFARVARYEVAPERIEQATAAFGEAAAQLEGIEGLVGGYVLTDAEDGVVMSMTLWENRAAMEQSEVQASGLRQQAAKQVDGTVVSVHQLDVVIELGATTPGRV
jgi:heme-degrading monooxygenase HmoA